MTSEAYESLRQKGAAMAGEPGDFSRRAGAYHRIYRDSGKRHVFPLIAAHGALWAAGYFKMGMAGARVLSLADLFSPARRQAKLDAVALFARRFREINRRVCAESYAIYYYVQQHGNDGFIQELIGPEFAAILQECHESIRSRSMFTPGQRERLFTAFFNWEQDNIVVPMVELAFADMQWKALRYFALRPKICFSYFGRECPLQFEDFSSKAERVRHGLQAYARAEVVGLHLVEDALQGYQLKSWPPGLPASERPLTLHPPAVLIS